MNGEPFRPGHFGNPKAREPYRADGYATISVAEWAYLAGIIDGEGSFYVCFDRRNEVYNLEVSVSNTSRSLIEWLLLHFGGTERLIGRSRREGCPDKWAWVVRGRKAAPIIDEMLPYLVVKTRQAKLAEKFIATYEMLPDRAVRNAERQRLKAAITALNCLKGKQRQMRAAEAEDPRGTSQKCECGRRVPKDLSVRVHRCPGCGAVEGRDVMAARVILPRHLRRIGTGTGPGARSEPVAAQLAPEAACFSGGCVHGTAETSSLRSPGCRQVAGRTDGLPVYNIPDWHLKNVRRARRCPPGERTRQSGEPASLVVTWTVVAACRQRAAGWSRARRAGLSRAGSGSRRSALVTGLGLAGRGIEAFRRLYQGVDEIGSG